jgi:hypothetical protein
MRYLRIFESFDSSLYECDQFDGVLQLLKDKKIID